MLHLAQEDNAANDNLLYLGFNQDQTCLSVGTDDGFRIFHCDPYRETFQRELSGGVGICEMLFRCNILALVGGGKQPAFDKNKVIIWDDKQKQPIGELKFSKDVKAVKLRRDKIIVVLANVVFVYNLEKLEKTHKFSTIDNEKGLVALSPYEQCVLAFPHTVKGEVCVTMLDSGKTQYIAAHESGVQSLSLNNEGTRLATASQKGTLIRIFDTFTGQKLQEVRRGTEKAQIYCITFNQDSTFLCTSSDKGTVHIFSLSKSNNTTTETTVANRKSKISFFGGYFKSEWSLAYFKGQPGPSLCCFGQDKTTVLIWTASGSFYRLQFDPKKGGELQSKKFRRWYNSK